MNTRGSLCQVGSARRTATVALAGLFLSLTAACGASEDTGSSTSPGGKTTTIRLGFANQNKNVDWTLLEGAEADLGYLREENIKLEVQGFAGGAAVMQALAAGKIDMAETGTSTFYPAVAKGADIVAVCQDVPVFEHIPAVPEDSPLHSIADLKGHKVGVLSLAATQTPLIKGMLAEENVPADSVSFVTIPPGPQAIAAYEKGQIDVFGYWMPPEAEISALWGKPLRQLEVPKDFADLGFSQSFFVSGKYLKQNRDGVTAFLKTFAKTMTFANANPQAILDMSYKDYPSQIRSGLSRQQNEAIDMHLLQEWLKVMTPLDGKWCNTPEAHVTGMMDALVRVGQIPASVDLTGHWDNSLMEPVNSFDKAKIEADARAWKSTDHS